MDTESAVALVSVAAGGAATAAGQSAWTSLTALVRRTLGRDEPVVSPEDEEGVRALADRLAEDAAADAEFARQLREWAELHRDLLPDDGSARNVIGDEARIDGPVIQARDIHGGVSFG